MYAAIVGGVFTGLVGVTGFIGVLHMVAWQVLVSAPPPSGSNPHTRSPLATHGTVVLLRTASHPQAELVVPVRQFSGLLLLKRGTDTGQKYFLKK